MLFAPLRKLMCPKGHSWTKRTIEAKEICPECGEVVIVEEAVMRLKKENWL